MSNMLNTKGSKDLMRPWRLSTGDPYGAINNPLRSTEFELFTFKHGWVVVEIYPQSSQSRAFSGGETREAWMLLHVVTAVCRLKERGLISMPPKEA